MLLGLLGSFVGIGSDARDASARSFCSHGSYSLGADDFLNHEVQECCLAVCSFYVGEFEEGVEPERLRASAVGSVVHAVAGFENCFE